MIVLKFGDNPKEQCEDFINWYLDNNCGSDSNRDLSTARCYFDQLHEQEYPKYCTLKGISAMDRTIFDKNCGTIINSHYLTKREKPKKNDNSGYRKYIYFDKPPRAHSKKK